MDDYEVGIVKNLRKNAYYIECIRYNYFKENSKKRFIARVVLCVWNYKYQFNFFSSSGIYSMCGIRQRVRMNTHQKNEFHIIQSNMWIVQGLLWENRKCLIFVFNWFGHAHLYMHVYLQFVFHFIVSL